MAHKRLKKDDEGADIGDRFDAAEVGDVVVEGLVPKGSLIPQKQKNTGYSDHL